MSNSEPRRDPKGTEFENLGRIPLRHEDRVLDIGCGDGRLTRLFARDANFVVGSDVDVDRVREAQLAHLSESTENQHFTVARAEAFPFAKETFSMAIFSWSL